MRGKIVSLINLAGRPLSPSLIQDVLAGDDKKSRSGVHAEIRRMIDDGSVSITIDWCLRLA